MVSLTDSSYKLPTIEALSCFGQFHHGTTLPMAIWGVDTKSGERGKYVVKFKNQTRMSNSASAFEYLGAWMALEMGLFAAEPVVVTISEDFVSTLSGRDGYKAARQSMGVNFGSRYVAGVTQIPPSGYVFSKEQVNQAKQLFVLDLFIQNIDRGHQKPNVGFLGDQLFIYDHELAFSFTRQLSFTRNKLPWFIDMDDSELYKKHFFYRYLKELGECEFAIQVHNLKRLGYEFWIHVDRHMPNEFHVAELIDIKNYLLPILDHESEFTSSIQKIMTL